MILFIILKIVTTAVMAFFAIACVLDAPKQKKSIRRSYFICIRNVSCVWNNFHVGIAYVVTGDYANYPISQC